MSQSSSSASSGSSSSTEDEEEEEEVPPPPPKKPVTPPPAPPRKFSKPSAAGPAPKPKSPTPSSSEDEDDGEAEESSGGDSFSSDTDGNSAKSQPPPVKPAAPTPAEPADSGSTDDDSASSDHPSQPAVPVPPTKSPISKLPKPEHKKLKVEETSSPKRHPLIWSDEDEIALLRGMVEYHAKSGRAPSLTNMDAFCEIINKSLNVDATKTQLWSKVRRLRKKYVTAAAQGKEGADPYFAKAHDRASFELCKQIWPLKVGLSENGISDEHGEDDATGEHKKIKDEQLVARKKQSHSGDSSRVSAHEDYDMMEVKFSDPLLRQAALYAASKKQPAHIAMEAVEMVDPSKAATIKEKYKKLILSEMKHNLQGMELLKESAKLFMDAIEKMD